MNLLLFLFIISSIFILYSLFLLSSLCIIYPLLSVKETTKIIIKFLFFITSGQIGTEFRLQTSSEMITN